MFVRLSVCLSQAGVVSKRLHAWSELKLLCKPNFIFLTVITSILLSHLTAYTTHAAIVLLMKVKETNSMPRCL